MNLLCPAAWDYARPWFTIAKTLLLCACNQALIMVHLSTLRAFRQIRWFVFGWGRRESNSQSRDSWLEAAHLIDSQAREPISPHPHKPKLRSRRSTKEKNVDFFAFQPPNKTKKGYWQIRRERFNRSHRLIVVSFLVVYSRALPQLKNFQ